MRIVFFKYQYIRLVFCLDFFSNPVLSLCLWMSFSFQRHFFGHWILYCIVNYIMTGIVRLGGGGVPLNMLSYECPSSRIR
jgi:hypothetical protein